MMMTFFTIPIEAGDESQDGRLGRRCRRQWWRCWRY